MSKSPPIKPGLIIYRSHRHSIPCQSNTKYSQVPTRVDHYMNHFQKRFPTLPVESYITKVTHTLSCDVFADSNFLKFLTKTRNIKRLALELTTGSCLLLKSSKSFFTHRRCRRKNCTLPFQVSFNCEISQAFQLHF